MPFSFDLQQRPERSVKSFIKRHRVLVPLIAFVILATGFMLIGRAVSPPLIGVLTVEGVILESETTIKQLKELEKHPRIKGIVLRINSPGGSVAPSQEIFSELKRINEKKTIYSSVSSVAASGGYYIALGTERIYANPGSLIGSIGVIMQTFNVEELLTHLGIEVRIIKTGKYKDITSSFRQMTAEERKLLESVLADTHEQFIEAVNSRRPLDLDPLAPLADGRFVNGRQAVQNQLIDGTASFRETVEKLRRHLNLSPSVQLSYATDRKQELLSFLDIQSWLPVKKIFTYSGLFYLSPALTIH